MVRPPKVPFRKATLLLGAVLALAAASLSSAAAGEIDPTFGEGGVVTVPGGGAYESVLVQPDGKILAGGYVSNSGLFFATVARFDDTGTLDPTFGNAGVTTFAYGDQFHGGEVFALELQPDGRILAGGTTNTSFALARLHSDGTLDADFGTGGISVLPTGEGMILDVALEPDGTIVAAGRLGSVFGFSGNHKLGLMRVSSDGTPDTSFGTSGLVAADFAGGFLAATSIQPDGRVLAGGASAGFQDFQLGRYAVDGSLDETFGAAGYARTDFSPSDVIQGIAVHANGGIVVAGASINRGDDFALARYASSGIPDESFGDDGKVETEFTPFDQSLAYAVTIQPDGKIVAAGCTRNCDRLAVARFETDGSLDQTFGTGGLVASDTLTDTPAIALQSDGKLVASLGGHFLPSPQGNALARLLSSEAPDVTQGTHDRFEGLSGLTGEAACRAQGWAFNSARPGTDLTVRVLVDGSEVMAGLAGEFRQDLLDAGIGDGTAAFDLDVSGFMSSGIEHEVRVQALDLATGDWVDLAETPKRMTCTELFGNHDAQEGAVAKKDCYATGWAFDGQTPTTRVQVRVRVNGKVVAETTANQLRGDVSDAGFGDGYSGWTVPLLGRVQPGKESVIRAEARDTQAKRLWYPLWSSDKGLTCGT